MAADMGWDGKLGHRFIVFEAGPLDLSISTPRHRPTIIRDVRLVESREAPLGERLEALRVSVERGAGDDPDVMAERVLRELGGQASDDVALLVVQVL